MVIHWRDTKSALLRGRSQVRILPGTPVKSSGYVKTPSESEMVDLFPLVVSGSFGGCEEYRYSTKLHHRATSTLINFQFILQNGHKNFLKIVNLDLTAQ